MGDIYHQGNAAFEAFALRALKALTECARQGVRDGRQHIH